MRVVDDVLAMRKYLRTVEELEIERDKFQWRDWAWVEYDSIITSYMEMWGQRYDRLLNAPRWVYNGRP